MQDGTPEPGRTAASGLAQRWRRSVASVVDHALRAGYMKSEVLAADAADAARALEEICIAAEAGDVAGHDVIAALAPVLPLPELAGRCDELRALAAEHALAALWRVLRRPWPVPADEAAEKRAAAPVKAQGRSLTLGERKSMARRPSRRMLDDLMRDPDPAVVRTLLANPRLTESDVVRMVARRPGSPQALAEIARNTKWMLQQRVRRALVQNPATPPEVALPVVSLLLRPELEDLAAAADAPSHIRNAAAELLARRMT